MYLHCKNMLEIKGISRVARTGNSLSVRSSSCAAVVNICGGRRGIGGGIDSSCPCEGTGSLLDNAPILAEGPAAAVAAADES